MGHLGEARFCRAYILVLNICAETLRSVIDHKIGDSTFEVFLNEFRNKHELFHLMQKKVVHSKLKATCCCGYDNFISDLRKQQWDLLYVKTQSVNPHGNKRLSECPCMYEARSGVQTEIMDVTFCCLFINKVCHGYYSNDIKTIRNARNDLAHSSRAILEEHTYQSMKQKVTTAILNLSKCVSNDLHAKTSESVHNLEQLLLNVDDMKNFQQLIVRNERVCEIEKTQAELTASISDIYHIVSIIRMDKLPRIDTSMSSIDKRLTAIETNIGHNDQEVEVLYQRQENPSAGNEKVKELRDLLLHINSNATKKVSVSPLQKTGTLAIEELFSPVVIREDLEYKSKGRNVGRHNAAEKNMILINYPKDMFLIDGRIVENIYLLGDTAYGKTCYSLRIAKFWCDALTKEQNDLSDWEQFIHQFSFVFLVKLRQVEESRISISEMICHDIFKNYPHLHGTIRHVISSTEYKCLIIADGLDDWISSHEAQSHLQQGCRPNTDGMAYCTFFFTSTPWKFDHIIETLSSNDRVLEIHGLDTENIHTLIRNILVNYYGIEETHLIHNTKYKEIMKKTQDDRHKLLMKVPLIAIAFVQLWYEQKELGNSLTSFFIALVDVCISRAIKMKRIPETTRETAAHFILSDTPRTFFEESLCKIQTSNSKHLSNFLSLLIKLGGIAFDDITTEGSTLVFPKSRLEELIGLSELDYALKIGLLSQCEAPSVFAEENVSLNFFHKIMQEFLAAFFILTKKHARDSFLKFLTSTAKIMEFENLIIFASGLSPSFASILSRSCVEVFDNDTDIAIYRKTLNSDKYFQVRRIYQFQLKIHREIKRWNSGEAYKRSEMKLHVSDVYIEGSCDNQTEEDTIEIINNNYRTIRSLYLNGLRSGNGKFDVPLTTIFKGSTSLQALYLFGECRIHSISDIFSSISALEFYNVNMTAKSLKDLKKHLKSNKSLQTLGLMGIMDSNVEGGALSIEKLIRTLPELKGLRALRIQVMNGKDADVLKTVLPRLSHLQCMGYFGIHPSRPGYDAQIISEILKWTHLRRIWFGLISDREELLCRLENMEKIEEIKLFHVNMKPLGWIRFLESLERIQYCVLIILNGRNIDETFKEAVRRKSSHFKVKFDITYENGLCRFEFDRIFQSEEQIDSELSHSHA